MENLKYSVLLSNPTPLLFLLSLLLFQFQGTHNPGFAGVGCKQCNKLPTKQYGQADGVLTGDTEKRHEAKESLQKSARKFENSTIHVW